MLLYIWRGDGNIKTITEIIKQNQKYSKILKRNYEFEVLKINEFTEEKMKYLELASTLKEYRYGIMVVQDTISKTCEHELVINVHGSMVTGMSSDYTPNPNHICNYCVACGKWLKNDEIMPWAYQLNFWGHPDALLVGNVNSCAIVDYLQNYALKEVKENPYYSIEEFCDEIKSNVGNIEVSQKCVRRS